MASAALMGASIGFSALQMASSNRAARRRQSHATRQADAQVRELKRQRQRQDEIAQENKSDVAREADRQLGALIAASADGGVTTASLARSAGAVGGIEGIDLGRIESNRIEDAKGNISAQTSIIEEDRAMRSQTRSRIVGNTLSFLGRSASQVSGFLKKE